LGSGGGIPERGAFICWPHWGHITTVPAFSGRIDRATLQRGHAKRITEQPSLESHRPVSRHRSVWPTSALAATALNTGPEMTRAWRNLFGCARPVQFPLLALPARGLRGSCGASGAGKWPWN
jgi:hypothetical protein